MPRPALWTAIAETLRKEIAARQYAPGARLPTEAEMSQRFGVNRHTVRRALGHLSDAGLVVTRRGAGAFVTTRPSDYPLGSFTPFTQDILAAGRGAARRLLRLDTVAAEGDEAAALDLSPGAQVHICEGLSFMEETPVGLFRNAFPAARFPGLLNRLQEDPSISAALRFEGVEGYQRASTRLSATLATEAQAELLRLTPGAPILRSVAINVDSQGQPVDYGCIWFVGDRMTLTLASEA